jgi:hypothetical protein
VKHAGPEALDRLGPLIEALRGLDGLIERRPGVFYRGSKAFLHFHEDPSGLYADVRLTTEFERLRVETQRERATLVKQVRNSLAHV